MSKEKKNKKMPTKFAKAMMTALLLPATMFPAMPSVDAANGTIDVKEILNNLTDAQRKSLNKLKVENGFKIDPAINLMSEKPINVIVQFKQEPAKVELAKQKNKPSRSSVAQVEAKVEQSHKQFKEVIQNVNKSKKSATITITHEYRDAFNGVAITAAGNVVEELVQTGAVERVWKDEEIKIDLPAVKERAIQPKMIDSIPQIGVDKLHNEDIKGQGIKVGVLDTGIDYNHPDLQGAYGGYKAVEGQDSSKVDPDSVKGWDYIDNDADPMETTYDEWKASGKPEFDSQGNAYYTSHGTHVSGTVAGQQDNNVDYAVKGVAPEVDLYNYRVLGPYGSGPTSGILAGIDKAVKDEMDVINLSLGSNVNQALNPLSIAVNNAMLADVVTVVAAGNAGPGAGTVGTPGAGALAITVGASDVSQVTPTFKATANEETFADVQLLAKNFTDNIEGLQNQSYAIVDVGLGAKSDFAGKDLTGKIALIERGELAFDEKVRNAKEAGAVAAIVFNNAPGQIPVYMGESTGYVTSFRISQEDGKKLKEALAANVSEETEAVELQEIVESVEVTEAIEVTEATDATELVKLTEADEVKELTEPSTTSEVVFTFGEVGNTKSEGDYLADFSSRGPVAGTLDIKPDVVAPGVAIYSTYPSFINDPEGNDYATAYARIQGTSMASPHVAGAAALILQENPDYTAFDVKAALMNTSVDLREDYSVYEVGAGRINAYDAVHTDTSIKVLDQTEMVEGGEVVEINQETASFSFGAHAPSEDAIEEGKTMVIKNSQTEDKKFAFDVEFLQAKGDRQDAAKNGVRFDVPNTVTVPAGKTTELEPTIHVPKDAAEGTYEGYIHIVNESNPDERYQVPFAIRITGNGIDFVQLERPVITNSWDFPHEYLIPFTPVIFKFKSTMETINIIINDAETGEPIGLGGFISDASYIPAGTEMYITQGFTGHVNLFTGDPLYPISDELFELPEGNYTFTLIATDSKGNTYVNENVAVVDNTGPEMTFKDYKPGIHEVDESMYTDEDGHHAVWVHTNVHDASIDYLKSKGLNYDQSSNLTVYYEDSPFAAGLLPVKENGDMKFGVLAEEIANKPYKLSLSTIELGTTERFDRYTFVKEGTLYAAPSYDKTKVQLNDEVTATLTLNNVKDLAAGQFDVAFANKHFKFKGVQASDALKKYAADNNLEIALNEPTFKNQDTDTIVTLGATLEGASLEGISGDQAFLDVTFEVINDEIYDGTYSFDFRNIAYTSVKEDKPVTVPQIKHDLITILPQTAKVQGYISPEALLEEDGEVVYGVDLSKIGAKVYVQAPNGKKFAGDLDENGVFFIEGIEVQKGDYKIIVDVPGHLTRSSIVKVVNEIDGDLTGRWLRTFPPINYAGDVNKDGMIDIMDVMRVVAQYGTKDKAADINIDGIVDELDIRLIEQNFLRTGHDAGKNKKPVEKLGKKGLNDFLQSLGLTPNK
ncbi:S8 family serine peptidase [Sporosarcina sp. NPDC096371]|uniref:S8 family serine peptidase n=1 Tax=Sporosarcina sp. NPDC096371 TaxID=3364530 RepID=UPI0037FF43F8